MKLENVLSLFDGMSCMQLALNEAGIEFENYYASEIDKAANKVVKIKFPDTIQLGDVTKIDPSLLPKIDLLCGGSPCQSFSFCGKMNGMTTTTEEEITTLDRYLELKEQGFEFEGQSYLFWEFVRILTWTKPRYFFLENVKMQKKWQHIISEALDTEPILINSARVSAQNRERLYWTNIGANPSDLFGRGKCTIPQPKDLGLVIKDILEPEVDKKYYLSEKMLNFYMKNHEKMKSEGKGFSFDPNDGSKKSKIVTTKEGSRMEINFVIQLNPSKESGGKQPFQQNRIYSTEGKSPAIAAQLSIGSNYIQLGNHQNDRIYSEDSKMGTLCSGRTDSKTLTFTQGSIRRLTPIEVCRLQTVPDDYFFENGVQITADTNAYKMLGNGWTVKVISHFLKHLK